MQPIAKIIVPSIDIQIVNQMLSVTSVSFIVSVISLPDVEKNIPNNGAMMNSSTSPPKKLKTSISLLFFTFFFSSKLFK